ncbi:MAG: hypothetical protein ABIK37_06850, partial [candidate division WOR-3 bacterium]
MTSGEHGRIVEARVAGSIQVRLWMSVALAAIWSAVWAQDTVWTRRFDSGRTDSYAGGDACPDGGAVVAGQSLTEPGQEHPVVSLVKYTPAGDTVWTRTYDSEYDDFFGCVAVDAQENVIVTGHNGQPAAGLVLKYDSSGDLLWTRRYGHGNLRTYLIGVTCDASGSIYASGYAAGGSAGDDVILLKCTADGDLDWVKTFDLGGNIESIDRLTLGPGGTLVGTGNTGDVEAWTFDFLTVKFTLDGDTVWSRRLDVQAEDWGCGIAVDSSGFFYATGYAGEFGVIPDSGVTMCYSSAGELMWWRTFGAGDIAGGSDVTLTPDGMVLVVGYAADTLASTHAILLLAFDPDGETAWTRTLRPHRSDVPTAVRFANRTRAYVIGVCTDSTWPSSDFFLMKLRYGSGVEEPELVGVSRSPAQVSGPTLMRHGELLGLTVKKA